MQPVYETVEALILELTRYRSKQIIMTVAHLCKSHTKVSKKKLYISTVVYLYNSHSKIAEKKVHRSISLGVRVEVLLESGVRARISLQLDRQRSSGYELSFNLLKELGMLHRKGMKYA